MCVKKQKLKGRETTDQNLRKYFVVLKTCIIARIRTIG